MNVEPLQLLLESPAARKAVADRKEELLEQRRRAIAELARLAAERTAEHAELEREFAAARADLEPLRTAMAAATQRCNEIAERLHLLSYEHPHAAAHVMLLNRTAPPAVIAFLQWLGVVEAHAFDLYVEREIEAEHVPFEGRRMVGTSNAPAINTCIAKIRSARERATAMLGEAVSDVQVEVELKRLRASIPTNHVGANS
jgi:hypothetical protein